MTRNQPYTDAMASVATAQPRGRYRLRTWLRGHAPMALVDLLAKGRDCGSHEWYRATETVDRCYHCELGERAHRPILAPVDYELRVDLRKAADLGSPSATDALERLERNDRELARQIGTMPTPPSSPTGRPRP